MNELFRPISALRGVGEKRAKAYARLGIQTPYDLLFHIPRSYLDFRNPEPVLSAPLDTPCVVEGCITRKLPEQRIRKGLSVFKATATDGESDFTVVFYNNFYAFDALKVGETYRFAGKLTGTLLRREIHSPPVPPGGLPGADEAGVSPHQRADQPHGAGKYAAGTGAFAPGAL